jgi:hypothetical protein
LMPGERTAAPAGRPMSSMVANGPGELAIIHAAACDEIVIGEPRT